GVRGEEDGFAELGEALDHLPGVAARPRIEAGGGLVEEQQRRVSRERDRDVQPPPLPARQLGHPGVALLLEPYQLQHLITRSWLRVVAAKHVDGLSDREVRIDASRLKDDAELFLEAAVVGGGVVAKDRAFAAAASPAAFEDLDRGGLSRAVGPEHGEHLALSDGEADALNSPRGAVRLVEVDHLDR